MNKTTASFEQVFERLKQIFQPLADNLAVVADEPGKYYLKSAKANEKNREIVFGGVEIKKNYVSFHLVPVYEQPELLDDISPELKKAMQGKSCFNFKKIDEPLFTELDSLTKTGFDNFKQKDMI